MKKLQQYGNLNQGNLKGTEIIKIKRVLGKIRPTFASNAYTGRGHFLNLIGWILKWTILTVSSIIHISQQFRLGFADCTGTYYAK